MAEAARAFKGIYDKRGGGTRLFGSKAPKTRFLVVEATTRTLSWYETEAAYEAHPQKPLKPGLPLALYQVGPVTSAPDGKQELHLTLLDAKDTMRPELVISQTIFKPPAALGPKLEELREALVSAGAKGE